MHRFYLPQELNREILMVRDRATVHQLKNVLKIRKGERVAFFNDKAENAGFDFVGELNNVESGAAAFMLKEKIENRNESLKKLFLYQSLIKKDRFEWILEKATEVGVAEIIPIISVRSEKKSLNTDRCQKILKEASEQSGRALIPKLHNVLSFERAVALVKASDAKTYFASESEKENTIHGVGERVINLFIGPEGGWEEREIFAAGHSGFEIISLGRLTLRSETAALAASYTLLWG